MLLSLQVVGDTSQVGDRAGPGNALLLSLPWGSQSPKCQAAPGSPTAVPSRFHSLGICVSLDPSRRDLGTLAGRVAGQPALARAAASCFLPHKHRAAPERLGVPGCSSWCLWAQC